MALVYDNLVLCKLEDTKGTDAVPVASTNAIRLLARPNPTVNRSNIERNVTKQTMGNIGLIPDPDASVELSLEVELKGSGTAGTAPDWGPLMQACRMVETVVARTSVTYAPSTPVEKSCTIYTYVDGVLWKMLGAVGTCQITTNPGEFPKASFTMTAPYIAPVNAAVPTGAAFDASVPKVISSQDLVNDGAVIKVGSLSLDFGNDVQEHRTIGNHEWVVANRNPTLTLNKDSVSTAAEWTAVDAGTNASISATFNAGAGNNIAISAPKAVRQGVTLGERAERHTLEIAYNLYETTSDDQFSIQLT
jgi:hypothetical protein